MASGNPLEGSRVLNILYAVLTKDKEVVVERGLRPGDRVVVAGVYHLQEGARVTVEESKTM